MPRRLAAALLLLTAPARADLLVVDGVVGPHLSVQAAVDAAADGDTVLVMPGLYDEVVTIVDKALVLTAASDSGARLAGLVIRDLQPGRGVVVRGFVIDPLARFESGAEAAFVDGIVVADALGAVRIEGCEVYGGTAGASSASDGRSAVRVQGSGSVALLRCVMRGGSGLDADPADAAAGHGGPGLFVLQSRVVASGCTMVGGNGGHVSGASAAAAGDGADGVLNAGGELSMAGCVTEGGDGGGASCTEADGAGTCGAGGPGGDGTHQTGPLASLAVQDVLDHLGHGGLGGDGVPGEEGGLLVVDGGRLLTFPGIARRLQTISPHTAGTELTLFVEGEGGDQLMLWVALHAGHVPLPAQQGVALIGHPLGGPLPLGMLAVTGCLEVPMAVPPLGPALDAITLHLQLVASQDGALVLGASSALTLLAGAP